MSIEFPKTIAEVVKTVGPCNFDTLMNCLKVTKEQQSLLMEKTINQNSSNIWFQHRKDRIAASNFKSAVSKVKDNNVINNPHKSKSLIKKICGYCAQVQSKATSWGINNEQVALKKYLNINKQLHKTFKFKMAGFYTSLLWPFLGASPDALVSCKCHEPGLLEIKCPWTHRGLTIKEFTLQKNSFLEVHQDKLCLKRDHAHFYQVQLQMYVTGFKWCDFFVYMTKDYFCERVYVNYCFIEKAIPKAKIIYEQLIMPEICFRVLYHKLIIEDVVKILNDMLNKVCQMFNENFEEINEIIDFRIES